MVRKGSSVRVRFRAFKVAATIGQGGDESRERRDFGLRFGLGSPFQSGEMMVSIESGRVLRAALLLVGALCALAAMAPAASAAPANDSFLAAETLPADLPASGSGSTLG